MSAQASVSKRRERERKRERESKREIGGIQVREEICAARPLIEERERAIIAEPK